MKTWVRKSLSVGILAAAALLFAPGAAHADAPAAPAGTTTTVAGSQNYSPITVPVTLNGTSLGNLGGTTVTVEGRTESIRTTQRKAVAPAVAGIPVTESATGGHGNGNGFCDNSLHFLGGGPSFRCGGGFHGHGGFRGHGGFHGHGAFLGDSIGDFDDIAFYGDDFDDDDLFLGDTDDPDGDDLLPANPATGNGTSTGGGYGNTAPATGNGNAAPVTNDGYGNVSPTTGNGTTTPTTGDLTPATGDLTPATGDLTPTTAVVPPVVTDVPPAATDMPPTTGGYGDVSPTKPSKPTKPAVKPTKPVKHHKPAVSPVTIPSEAPGYGDVSPATGSDTTTDGGRTAK